MWVLFALSVETLQSMSAKALSAVNALISWEEGLRAADVEHSLALTCIQIICNCKAQLGQ